MKYQKRKKAVILLVDGTIFHGKAVGKDGSAFGEVCFNTGMTTINGKCITIARLTSMISIWDSEEEFMTKGELYLWENQAAAFFNQGGILQ